MQGTSTIYNCLCNSKMKKSIWKSRLKLAELCKCAFFLFYVLTVHCRKLSRLWSHIFVNLFFCPKNNVCQFMFLFDFWDSLINFISFCFQSHTLSSLAMRLRVSSLYLSTLSAIMFLSCSLRIKKKPLSSLYRFFRQQSCKKDLT